MQLPKKANEHSIKYYRDNKNFKVESFSYNSHNALADFFAYQHEWNDDNFNGIFNEFTAIVSKIIDIHAPLKRLSRRQKSFHNKPWFTKRNFNAN